MLHRSFQEKHKIQQSKWLKEYTHELTDVKRVFEEVVSNKSGYAAVRYTLLRVTTSRHNLALYRYGAADLDGIM